MIFSLLLQYLLDLGMRSYFQAQAAPYHLTLSVIYILMILLRLLLEQLLFLLLSNFLFILFAYENNTVTPFFVIDLREIGI